MTREINYQLINSQGVTSPLSHTASVNIIIQLLSMNGEEQLLCGHEQSACAHGHST
jgi:hypothetical protein